jgi:Holliday junction resolvase
MTKPLDKDPTAYAIYEALQLLGSNADPQALVAQVKKLNLGLPAEDEFVALLGWLGHCHLVHKLDQFQVPPSSKPQYQVPDLVAVFDYEGQHVPTLIEVKTKRATSLSWRPDYYLGLRRYADELGMPILVAWKFAPISMWVLCELKHFRKSRQNYKLSFETAAKQNLLSILAGDFGYILEPGVGMHLKLKKLQPVRVNALPPGQTVRVRVDDAYFANARGERFSSLKGLLWPLFLAADQAVEVEEDEEHFYQSYVIPPKPGIEWAHRTLPVLMSLSTPSGQPIPWRVLLRKRRLPIQGDSLSRAAMTAVGKGMLRAGFTQQPHEVPAFLKKTP